MQLSDSNAMEAANWRIASSEYKDLQPDIDRGVVDFTWIDTQQFSSSKTSLLSLFVAPTIFEATVLPTADFIGHLMPSDAGSVFGCVIL